MDYIYAADADEMLDETNRTRFLRLKQCLLPEIEIVQMKYVTKTDFNTVLNFKKEYRPKLYKRLRSFTWVDPIHETVRLDPVVFDSDVEILHMPPAPHQNRDFSIFRQAYQKDGILSNKIFDMYAKELFISGSDMDFADAAPIFRAYLASPAANEPKDGRGEDFRSFARLRYLKRAKLRKSSTRPSFGFLPRACGTFPWAENGCRNFRLPERRIRLSCAERGMGTAGRMIRCFFIFSGLSWIHIINRRIFI